MEVTRRLQWLLWRILANEKNRVLTLDNQTLDTTGVEWHDPLLAYVGNMISGWKIVSDVDLIVELWAAFFIVSNDVLTDSEAPGDLSGLDGLFAFVPAN